MSRRRSVCLLLCLRGYPSLGKFRVHEEMGRNFDGVSTIRVLATKSQQRGIFDGWIDVQTGASHI